MWERKYTDDQREAMLALMDEGKTAGETSKLLAAIGFPPLEVEPFEAPEATIRSTARKLRQKRAGETFSVLSRKSDQVATDELRARLITIADRESRALASQQASGPGRLDLKRMRELAQVTRELSLAPPKAGFTKGANGKQAPGKTAEDPFLDQLSGDGPASDDVPTTTTDTALPQPTTPGLASEAMNGQTDAQGAGGAMPPTRED